MSSNRLWLAITCLWVISCAATRPAARFERLREITSAPIEFDSVSAVSSQADAKISIKVPGLHGVASGIVRHAKADQYLIELFGREALFLKVYFTGKQTILWPAIGSPTFFSSDSTPTLKESVHSLLPEWRLDDVLPVPQTGQRGVAREWRLDSKNHPTERLSRPGGETIFKTYKTSSDDPAFPYRKVVLQGECGRTRLTWTLRPNSRPIN